MSTKIRAEGVSRCAKCSPPPFFLGAVVANNSMEGLGRLNKSVICCGNCPRLVRWRELVAKKPPLRYQGESCWAKPPPGFGDPGARIPIGGLAPAANGEPDTRFGGFI